MLTSYKEAYEVAKNANAKFSAYDFHYSDLVIVIHEEGSILTFKSAFLKEWKDYLFIFTEHHGFHVYHRGDLTDWGQYIKKPSEKLENTGLDHCAFCEKEMKIEELIYDHHPDWNNHAYQYYAYCKDCKDIESSKHKMLWRALNAKSWEFTWGVDNIENIKKACATIMKEEEIDKWLDTPSPAFPDTPRKTFEDEGGDEIYLAIYQLGSGEFN